MKRAVIVSSSHVFHVVDLMFHNFLLPRLSQPEASDLPSSLPLFIRLQFIATKAWIAQFNSTHTTSCKSNRLDALLVPRFRRLLGIPTPTPSNHQTSLPIIETNAGISPLRMFIFTAGTPTTCRLD